MRYLLILCAVMLAGCASTALRFDRNARFMGIFSKTEIPRWKPDKDSPGAELSPINVPYGDSAVILAQVTMTGWKVATYRLIEYKGEDFWTLSNVMKTRTEWDYDLAGGRIRVHKSKSDEAWSRATAWLSKHSDMKIQTATDNLLDTYNPTASSHGYTITRMIVGDSVEIDVQCRYNKANAYDVADLCDIKKQSAWAYILNR